MQLQGEQYFLAADCKQEGGYLLPTDYEQQMQNVESNPVQNALTSCVSLGWIRARLNRVLRHDGLMMLFPDMCRENVLKHESFEKILRGEPVTEQELDVQLEASRQEMKRLMMEEVLNGGYCEQWTRSWAAVRTRITNILMQRNEQYTSKTVFRGPPCVEFDPLIEGLSNLQSEMQQFTPPNWPGMMIVFAAMPSHFAMDGVAGGKSPTLRALLMWLEDDSLAARCVIDPVVLKSINDWVFQFSEQVQRPEWTISEKVDFRFRQ